MLKRFKPQEGMERFSSADRQLRWAESYRALPQWTRQPSTLLYKLEFSRIDGSDDFRVNDGTLW